MIKNIFIAAVIGVLIVLSVNAFAEPDSDPDDQWRMEYIEDFTGLKSMRIIRKDTEFVREGFPQHCFLERNQAGSDILLHFYHHGSENREEWNEEQEKYHVLLTFDCLNGQWVLTECTDDLTWTAEAKDGRVTFSDYKQPGPEWEWSAELDGDLMTFDFSALDALITRYNTLIPDRPSVTEP
ncbi:MAG: hypothetical protein IJR97_12880 [Clostridia bacterium]|nr:hypothetical protein [Clostridia bacterium]